MTPAAFFVSTDYSTALRMTSLRLDFGLLISLLYILRKRFDFARGCETTVFARIKAFTGFYEVRFLPRAFPYYILRISNKDEDCVVRFYNTK